MKCTLQSIRIQNFKGIKDLYIEAGGNDLLVYGDNATGKTTIFDAVTWLLYEKDSLGQSQFEIKPLDGNGVPQHGLDTVVEATISIDGTGVTLKKIFREKWTKKRGQAKAEFTGHTVKHFIDGVPVKKKDYLETVKKIASPEQFQLLTNPRYFCERWHWTDRRKLLLEMFVSREDLDRVERGEKERKKLMARMKEINEQLEQIPVRIDEICRSRNSLEAGQDFGSLTHEQIADQIRQITGRIKQKYQELARAEEGGQVAELEKTLAEKIAWLAKLEKQRLDEEIAASRTVREKATKLTERQYSIQENLVKTKGRIEELKQKIKRLEQEIEQKRKEWFEEHGRTFDPSMKICPTCGQKLPPEQIEKRVAEFNSEKAKRLASIQKEGKALKARLQESQNELEQLTSRKKDLEQQILLLQDEIKHISGEPDTPCAGSEITQKIKSVQEEIKELKEKIARARTDSSKALEPIRNEIAALEKEKEELEVQRRLLEQKMELEQRIEELKAEEKRLAGAYEDAERKLNELQEDIRQLVISIEDDIARNFQIVRFRLFHEQINGGLQDCCEVTVDGVPYSSLNNASRILAGLDIINTLSRHYNISLPIFIDNRESITKLIPVDAQIIHLIVSAEDKELRIERKEKEKEDEHVQQCA